MQSANYRTMEQLQAQRSSNWLAVGAVAIAAGLVMGLLLASSPAILTLPVRVPVQKAATTAVWPAHGHVSQAVRPLLAMQATQDGSVHSTSMTQQQGSSLQTAGWAMIASGCALLIGAAAKLLHKGQEAASGPAEYHNAEAQWAMTAATAFVGTKAPDFQATAVYDEEFVDIKLSSYRGKKYVVLFFYPLDFTFVCPTEITAFSDRMAEFSAIDTEVLGVSVDSQFSHLAWVQTPRNQGGLGEIAYPLVADLKKEIAEAYGVLTDEGVALRGLFIIDKEGVIQHATINNLAFGRNVDETLRVLEAVQHVQTHPDEVCPAGWKKGDKTMKPDPEGSKEYFAAI